jgi:anhydro-N-acetylmuramic acid kinase
MIILGLNSGTSQDGVSAAIFETLRLSPSAKIKLLFQKEFAYPDPVLKELSGLYKKPSLERLARAHFYLGEVFAGAALKAIRQSRVKSGAVDLVASHGQTIGHFPELKKIGGRKTRATLQIGEPAVIAQRTGITTVGDFRPGDIGAGGQGAPVLAYPECLLFGSGQKNRMALNLGGIANFSLIPKGADPEQVRATDAGPCNLLLDGLAMRVSKGKLKCDHNGKIALSGRPRKEWVEKFLKHKFFKQSAPKTSGREDFNEEWLDGLLKVMKVKVGRDGPDLLRSGVFAVARIIGQCCAENYDDFAIDEIIVSGGGAHNRALIFEIEQAMWKRVTLSTELGIPLQAKEPIGFGILAELCLSGLSGNLAQTTGAKTRAVLGKIVPGKNWRTLLKKVGRTA